MSDCSRQAWNVKASRPTLHTSPDISWSLCDGCRELTVKPRDWAKHERFGYYCDKLHANLTRKQIYDMKPDACPIGRDLKKRRFAE